MIFSNNIYYHYRIRCDVLSSKRKSYLDGNTTSFYNTPIYEEASLHVDYKKFKSKKQALEYCQKLIEQGFLEKKVPYYIERFRDALPKKLLDAMGYKVPVIVGPYDARRKIVERYNCGLVSEEWTDTLTTLANDKNLRKEMGENGFKAFKMNYAWELQEKKLLKVYKNLLEGDANEET